MRQFGLLGKGIAYSFSKSYFTDKFKHENIIDCVYDVFDLKTIDEVDGLFELTDLIGFNVTIPYKQEIIPYLDELSPEAKAIGAVNTVLLCNGKKIGHNTDYFGFKKSLEPLLNEEHKKALILGFGGAAMAVAYSLSELDIPYRVVSRNPKDGDLSYDDLDETIMNEHQLIINCSPVGTFPNITQAPTIPYNYISRKHLLYDLIYNPSKTEFLRLGEEKGAIIQNGHEMLILQADKSWEIWNNPSHSV